MAISIMIGDVREQLARLPSDSVDCVVTSPPYWGLRDYGVAGQIGMEATWADHLAVMLDVFRAVRRVIKPSATLWLNYGDGYATHPSGRKASEVKAGRHDDRTFRDKPMSTVGGSFKPKDLLMMPNRLAIALQDDGWWVRAECIWGKPNPMPDSSGRFRPAEAHEKIFMLGKTGSLYYDPEVVKKPAPVQKRHKKSDNWDTGTGGHDQYHRQGREKGKYDDDTNGAQRRFNAANQASTLGGKQRANGRLLRNYEPEIWHIPPVGYDEAHFATFPPALAQRCIMAGCPTGGVVLDPFGGAGTTGMVAAQLGRSAILIELNPDYAVLAQKRIEAAALIEVKGGRIERAEMPLFGDAA